MSIFSQTIKRKKSWVQINQAIQNKQGNLAIHGLDRAHTALFLGMLPKDRPTVYIADSDYHAKKVCQALMGADIPAVYLPTRQFVFYHVDAYSHELSYQRIQALFEILNHTDAIVCMAVDNLFDRLPGAKWFLNKKQTLQKGQEIDRDQLLSRLISLGYERVPMVEAQGQFSVRGGIVDCFGIGEKMPFRIEWFDDEVDSIRIFSKENQRSLDYLDEIAILPAEEMLIDNPAPILEKLILDMNKRPKGKEHAPSEATLFDEMRESLTQGMDVSNPFLLLPYHSQYQSSFFDYLGDCCYVMDDGEVILERLNNLQADHEAHYARHFEQGEALEAHGEMFLHRVQVENAWTEQIRIFLMPFLRPLHGLSFDGIWPLPWQEGTKYHGDLPTLAQDIQKKLKSGYTIHVALSQNEKIEHFIAEMANLEVTATKETEIYGAGIVSCENKSFDMGFEWREEKYILYTDSEIYAVNAIRKKSTRQSRGKPISSLSDLKVNDYVVHEKHGVGKYLGIQQLKVQEIRKDYLTIAYEKGDKLFVPVDQMDLVQKYIGAEAGTPKLNKLGGQEWQKTKYQAKKSIEEMAQDLIELYAKRSAIKGFGFSSDSIWQAEFEEAFAYEETEDQLRATEEIKRDMEQLKPMDRLLCGDVGFGKTEVALRAAFKAVQDSKQVAILVPTTILAQQHYNTISARFQDFPIRIQMLSRFRTPKQQTEILKGVKDGRIDIIIGTHRLLSKDMAFKNLGLLVVDEEQRFGVKHKEKLKKLKENVDVLTLTATPIPRTLHMSMVGIRDLSVIEEPPRERHPVQTFVVEKNDYLIRDVILKELSREGQVFYVYNRVKGIERIAAQIKKLVPEARIAVAHGQMGERELENIMIDFMAGDYDVLLCTTIIETGLDIANVNTMIVDNADQMGLSQLYQLRGRVGRSNRLAFAYLMYAKDKVLTEIAAKRLKAIKEFTEFGSGFKIAMRDLEIRGAGNLLGAAQHGHMMAIGYDLYVKYLSGAVSKLKTGTDETELETVMDLMADAFIPQNFIEEEEQRIDFYKRIASISDEESKSEIIDEMIDRYGDIPEACLQLIHIASLKATAKQVGIDEVKQEKERLLFRFRDQKFLQLNAIEYLMKQYPMKISFDFSKDYILYYHMNFSEQGKVIDVTEGLLKHIASFHFPDIEI